MSDAALSRGQAWLAWIRLRRWARQARVSRRLAYALAAAALACSIATYVIWTGAGPEGPNPDVVLVLLNIDLILLLSLGAVVLRRLVLLWIERRRGLAGAKLHARLVALFSVVAITPTIVVAVFSAMFFNFGLDAWFSERVSTALSESVAVADAYLEEHRQNIRADALAVGRSISQRAWGLTGDPSQVSERLSNLLEYEIRVRDLTEAVVFARDGSIIAQTALSFTASLEPISDDLLTQAYAEDALNDVFLLSTDSEDRVRALLRLDNFLDAYLVVGRFVDSRVLAHVDQVHRASDAYVQIQGKRSGLQLTFALIYVVVALLLLLAAVWVGLTLATRLAKPISGLVEAAERVRAGDLTARVVDVESRDEIGMLGRAFNRMTDQLAAQRRELIEANRQIDARRRFTESVLSGVSAGVLGLDAEGRIELPNRSALRLLGMAADELVGRPLSDAVPPMAALLETAQAAPDGRAEGQVEVAVGRRTATFFVRLTREEGQPQSAGYVLTFDDMTALVAAQRTAAWADVARRIAHEIKNPLTPIQLSAERLKRKYLRQIEQEPEVFTACTDTIVRQVGDLRRMVDEFSAFARMPAPSFAEEDLGQVVEQAVVLQEVAHPAIRFERSLPVQPLRAVCDGRLLAQVLTNLLQNAVDAIEGREAPAGEAAPPGWIRARLSAEGGRAIIEITDNGRGLPTHHRDRLTEPYVTTRAKGTGLGLAIVKRIVEDHAGTLALEDAPEGGATVRVVFPLVRAVPTAERDAPAVREARHGA